jgi:acetate kinase
MCPVLSSILSVNSGSSSIKFTLYDAEKLNEILSGEIARIGTPDASFSFRPVGQQMQVIAITAQKHSEAGNALIEWLSTQSAFAAIAGIGHRIVYGMKHSQPELITPALLKELKTTGIYDPEHMPDEIQLIELFSQRYPAVKQIACFDTAFHSSMPAVAKTLAIPRRYFAKGIQRYGFHGLSYSFITGELERLDGDGALKGRIILAHLGNGASLAAVKGGISVDTTMGFSPSSGLLMGTRTGDIDPGVVSYLMRAENIDPEAFDQLVNYESGLLGISGTSADMRQLLEVYHYDHRAAEAVELFCYQARKWIGSFAAVLEGLDTLVFSGGIGENAPEIRRRICDRLGFLGVELDQIKNINNEPVISSGQSKVCVRVIKTNEELTIARMVSDILNNRSK